jgi:protein ImuB
VWSPGWAIANWRRRHGASRDEAQPQAPFALIAADRGVRRLAAVNAAGAAEGLYVGQKATDAAALCPQLQVADAEPEADARALSALVDWCVRFSPAVAADPPDGLILDITGVAHLWGGEAAMATDLVTRLAAGGIPAQTGIADSIGAAWALSRCRPGAIALPGGQAALLTRLPVAALRLSEKPAAQLPRLGLATIGDLAALPRAQLTRRFGPEVVLRLDQALGRVEEAVVFQRPPTPWFTRLAFFEPISAPEDLARVTADISAELCARLEREGRGARRFELVFHRVDGRAVPLQVGLSLPSRRMAPIVRLFAPMLETVDPGFGIDAVTLTADEVEALGARQGRLEAGADVALEEGLAPLVDRLANRLGEDRVWRAEAFSSHEPERAVARRPPLSPKSKDAVRWDPQRPRPLRLFARPEPVEATAPVPDDPPVMFRWRGRLHRVSRAEGPERLAEEWWRLADFDDSAPDRVRDYYRVEDDAGARFWLFRAGLYNAETPARWWLHGLFG